MASTGFLICRSITFSGRLILPDRHNFPQPQSLCLRFLDYFRSSWGSFDQFWILPSAVLVVASSGTRRNQHEFIPWRVPLPEISSLSLTPFTGSETGPKPWVVRQVLALSGEQFKAALRVAAAGSHTRAWSWRLGGGGHWQTLARMRTSTIRTTPIEKVMGLGNRCHIQNVEDRFGLTSSGNTKVIDQVYNCTIFTNLFPQTLDTSTFWFL